MKLWMRYLNWRRLRSLTAGGVEAQMARKLALVQELSQSPRAVLTEEANRQHYELPPQFFEQVLGPHLKYSGAYWPSHVDNLAEAEAAMLDLYLERAELADGQQILELGCGWGSLSLCMARRFPGSRVVAVSNSHRQRLFIEGRALEQGLTNLEVRTLDVNALDASLGSFDRIVSVEMLEHVRNYSAVFEVLHGLLKPEGKLFVHIFCHARHPYLFEGKGWMERHFFAGGVMPSLDLLLYFSTGFVVEEQWAVDGRHYERTARAWLANMRAHHREVKDVLRAHYGRGWRRWWIYWQVFFLACAELFGYGQGQEWLVCHLRWRKARVSKSS